MLNKSNFDTSFAPDLNFTYFRCLGSTQHLKNKYGGGYVLEVKCNGESSDWEVLHKEILDIFDENKIKLNEAFADRRTYSVLQSAVTSLGEVFATLESCNYVLISCILYTVMHYKKL